MAHILLKKVGLGRALGVGGAGHMHVPAADAVGLMLVGVLKRGVAVALA
jgi:hypothetical protein